MSNNKLFVANIPFSIDDDSLANLFQDVGSVMSAKVIRDRDTGRSRGFGFVEMETDDHAQKAIEQFNGKDFEGRPLNVSVARPRN